MFDIGNEILRRSITVCFICHVSIVVIQEISKIWFVTCANTLGSILDLLLKGLITHIYLKNWSLFLAQIKKIIWYQWLSFDQENHSPADTNFGNYSSAAIMLSVNGIDNLIRDPHEIDFNSPEITEATSDITSNLNLSNVMFV